MSRSRDDALALRPCTQLSEEQETPCRARFADPSQFCAHCRAWWNVFGRDDEDSEPEAPEQALQPQEVPAEDRRVVVRRHNGRMVLVHGTCGRPYTIDEWCGLEEIAPEMPSPMEARRCACGVLVSIPIVTTFRLRIERLEASLASVRTPHELPREARLEGLLRRAYERIFDGWSETEDPDGLLSAIAAELGLR